MLTIPEGQRDSSESAGESEQLLIYLLRCAVSLSLKVPILGETVEIFTNWQERENIKIIMLRNQTVNINAKGSILGFLKYL